MKKRRLLLFLFLTSAAFLWAAEIEWSPDDPDWVLISRGQMAFEQDEVGEAFRIFRAVLGRDKGNADALLWMGILFEHEAELDLAEDYYHEALENWKQLTIADDRYTILYRLAELYAVQGQYGLYEETLHRILDLEAGEGGAVSQRQAKLNLLLEQGLQKMVTLYRSRDRKRVKAETDLAVFYYRTGRYYDALWHGLEPFLTVITLCFDYLREGEPELQLDSIAALMEQVEDDQILRDYIQESDFYRNLYYLGASLYAYGELSQAETVWRIVSRYGEGESWSARAAKQLKAPYIEPIISRYN